MMTEVEQSDLESNKKDPKSSSKFRMMLCFALFGDWSLTYHCTVDDKPKDHFIECEKQRFDGSSKPKGSREMFQAKIRNMFLSNFGLGTDDFPNHFWC